MKNQYSLPYIQTLADEAHSLVPGFNVKQFVSESQKGLEGMEMKARIKLIGEALFSAFDRDYQKVYAYGQLLFNDNVNLGKNGWKSGIKYDPLAYIIEHYGLEYFEESMFLIGEITKRYTSEFAIRNLIAENHSETLKVLEKWSKDENEHLRRLASEGSRTRLPWGKKLHNLIKEPHLTRSILENLKEDPAKYVQKSVANHLNDISKDHPAYFYSIVSDWSSSKNENTRWIIKHALRNEIKKGHPTALEVLGYKPVKISVSNYALHANTLKLGQHLQLQASIKNEEKTAIAAVIDFGIHLRKQNNSTFFKVFKWKNIQLQSGESLELTKKYLIQKITTRVYYAGNHQVDLLVNGKTMGSTSFVLEF